MADNMRSTRQKTALKAKDLGTSSTGKGKTGGKASLHHCNYCNKDISEKAHIKCAECEDFDLCIECFTVGAEVTPHKSNHSYRVMENLSFPLTCPDWNVFEENLLLDGLEMYGFGNWKGVAEKVGTKSEYECIDHYTTVYMNSPGFLPDLSYSKGKSIEELRAMGKEHKLKKEFPPNAELTLKEPLSSHGKKSKKSKAGTSNETMSRPSSGDKAK